MPPSWSSFTHNLPATPSGTTYGTSITTGINNNKGSVVDLLGSALTHDVELLFIAIHSFRTSTANGNALLDIMVDPAGGTDWDVLIPNLLAGWSAPANINNGDTVSRIYYFPIQIASGSTIGARAQTSMGSSMAGNVVIFAAGDNANPGSWWAGTSVEAIGVNAATSLGQMHTCGDSGEYSSWTNLGSTVSADSNAIQWSVQGENNTSSTSTVQHHFEFGAGSSLIGPPVLVGAQFTESTVSLPTMPIFRSIPSGTQLQVRGKASGTASPMDVAAWVVS